MALKTFTNNGLGRIYKAPADTAVGTTVSAIVTAVTGTSSAFEYIGDIDDGGLTITPRSVDNSKKDWNGKKVAEDVHAEWKFKVLDFVSDEAAELAFGAGNVTADGTTGATVDFDGETPESFVLVAIMKDGDRAVCAVLRNGYTDKVGDYTFSKGTYSVHDLTLKSEKPSDNGSACYMAYTRDLDSDSTEE